MPSARPRAVLILLAFACVWLIWGSSFLAIRVAIDQIPPLLVCALRQAAAGAILLVWARAQGARWPRRAEWVNAGLLGLLLPGIGNGGVTVGETHVSSGVTALLVSTIPLWVAVFSAIGPNARRPRPRAIVGLALGFAGIALLIGPGLARSRGADVHPGWAMLPVLASLSWAWGSLWSRRAGLPESPLLATAIGLLVSSVANLPFSVALGEWSRFSPSAVGAPALIAVAYLAVFGTAIAYSAYLFLLRNVSPGVVSTYAFVNPVVALALGRMFLGETLSPRTMIASVVVLAAVVLITTASASVPRTAGAAAGATAAFARRP